MKKAEHRRIDAFELWCWRRLLRVPWTARRSDQSILKEISHGIFQARVLEWVAVAFSNPYMTTRKTIALTRQTFVSKVMFLLFSILSRLVIAFLPRNKCLLISWLQSPNAVILEPKKIKSVTISIVSPSICHEVMGLDAMILVF